MTTLASAVAIGDNQLTIDAPMADALPAFVKIDSEILNVGGADNRTGTTLTLSAPATATHNNGATVTYAGRPYSAAFLAATAGEGGGSIPDPASGDDGDVPTVAAGVYELAASGAGDLLVVERTLTAAEIHTLNSVPAVLVEGVPNAIILPGGGWLVFHVGASPYVNAATLLLGTQLLINNGQHWFGEAVVGVILDQLVDSIKPLVPFVGAQRELAWAEGEDLILQMDGSDPDPAPDGDGTLDVVVFYRIVSV